MRNQWLLFVMLPLALVGSAQAQPPADAPAPPASVTATDHPWDGGQQIDLVITRSPDDTGGTEDNLVSHYVIARSSEPNGFFEEVDQFTPPREGPLAEQRDVTVTISQCDRGREYYFRVYAVSNVGVRSEYVQTEQAAVATREMFDGDRFWFAIIMLVLCGSVVWFIQAARSGKVLKIRKIAGLEAVDEAVGRATEMGRSCLFIPGIQDMNDIQTVAGITVLSRVAKVAAEYDAKVEVPTSRALVMTAARETVHSAFLSAGRPDSYNADHIYYVTDEQFGFVAYLSGMMVREKPAACFYMGSFYAESLILAETGNQIGAIQVAGTAMPTQLPFFVAACDYTLIGEEFFAASAYLSGEPDQLGSLKGQDVGKVIVAAGLLIGCILATVAAVTGDPQIQSAVEYLQNTMLK